jgi:hypothetical protein
VAAAASVPPAPNRRGVSLALLSGARAGHGWTAR